MKISKEKFEELKRQAIENDRIAKESFLTLKEKVFNSNSLLDADGYPTDDALSLVEIWHHSDIKGLFDFIYHLWNLKSFGWYSENGGIDSWTKMEIPETTTRYHLSTAGWSGNEAIIRCLEENMDVWEEIWVQSRVGGHYIFEVKNKD
jgi:hypothetical protein